ncbi:MAG: cadmium-translocating P-type ATPase [Spirochaetaceae bacterium]|nr:MAG: cadmium-translocating P-type ATPase [Spirochaetaceae bacterium]
MEKKLTHQPRVRDVPECPVPVEDRCCAATIYRTVQDEPAIREIRYDTAELEIELEYDPDGLDADRLDDITSELAHLLEERSATCRDREQRLFRRGCGICLEQIQRRARERGAAVECDSSECSARALMTDGGIKLKRGVLRVPQPAPRGRTSPWVTKKVRIGARPTPAESKPVETATGGGLGPRERLIGALRRLPLEPGFVVVTLVAMILGAVSERVGPAALTWSAYIVAYAFGGFFGVRASIESLSARKIDIDLLMVLAAIGAAAVGAPFEGALLLFLFSLSNVLQDFALDRTRNAIRALSKLRPDTALVLQSVTSERGRRVPVESIDIDTLVQVRPGDRIPLDGVVESGAGNVDQASITGESLPVEKRAGSEVLAGTINQDGELVIRVTKTSGDSTIARVITLVEEAQEQQAKTERFLERFEQYYAIGVILATVLAAVIPPMLLGTEWAASLYRAITLMVAASPCALIISTPASILSSIGNGARRGILFKGGVHVEQAAGIQAIAFDKTGTLTEGKPFVADIVSLSDWSEDDILIAAATLESKSAHVLAEAVTAEARRRELQYHSPTDFRSESGVGVRGVIDGREIRLGSPTLLDALDPGTAGLDSARNEIERLQKETKTVIVLVEDDGNGGRILGVISLEDRLKPGVAEVVRDLRAAGIKHVVMLTGDNRAAAEAIAAQAGIDAVYPELLPENKLDAIRRIEAEYGPTAMVGDGVNDAPALAGARLGIAMGAAGTDVALETADIVLLSDDLAKLPYLIALSRRTRKTLIVNIAVAMGLIAMMIVGIYTIGLPLPLAVIGHEGGTVLVSLNGVRLLMFKNRKKRRRTT